MRYLIVCILMLAGSLSYAQSRDNESQIGSYDPSFWKKELHLDNIQYRRMCEINREFYDRLISAFRSMKDDRNAFRIAFAQCWVNRNDQLLGTMNGRQQKKWKRIMVEKYHVENTQAQIDQNRESFFFYVSE